MKVTVLLGDLVLKYLGLPFSKFNKIVAPMDSPTRAAKQRQVLLWQGLVDDFCKSNGGTSPKAAL